MGSTVVEPLIEIVSAHAAVAKHKTIARIIAAFKPVIIDFTFIDMPPSIIVYVSKMVLFDYLNIAPNRCPVSKCLTSDDPPGNQGFC